MKLFVLLVAVLGGLVLALSLVFLFLPGQLLRSAGTLMINLSDLIAHRFRALISKLNHHEKETQETNRESH